MDNRINPNGENQLWFFTALHARRSTVEYSPVMSILVVFTG